MSKPLKILLEIFLKVFRGVAKRNKALREHHIANDFEVGTSPFEQCRIRNNFKNFDSRCRIGLPISTSEFSLFSLWYV